jgi:hypothetical protein
LLADRPAGLSDLILAVRQDQDVFVNFHDPSSGGLH